MKQYGMPYMGSKSKIAEDIVEFLPSRKRFVDLFGGGGAMSHCAALSGKYETVYYNEINPLVVDCFCKAIAGEYKNETRWISREDFKKLNNVDGYVKLCWSFGNKGDCYLYAKEIEPWKKALHYARVLGDCSLLKEFGIDSNGSRQDIKTNKDEYKEKYIKWYLKNICISDVDYNCLKNDLDKKIKDQKEELRQYLCNALKESGLTAAEVDRRLDTQMSKHYFGRSQWEFPTREEYNKMRAFMPLKPYDEVYGYQELLESLQSLQRLERLERQQSLERLQKSLESLERLESLQSLQRLERLKSLERLANFGKIQINCGSYWDYEYKDGDVVYCDPPYEGTAGYDENVMIRIEKYFGENGRLYFSKQKAAAFDSKAFYNWVAAAPFPVYFSSYEISDSRFYPLWQKEKAQLLSGQGSGKKKLEIIYSNHPCPPCGTVQMMLFPEAAQ